MSYINFILVLLLAGCAPFAATLPVQAKPSATAALSEPTETTVYLPTVVVTEVPYEQCAWVWANRELPAITADLNQAYQAAGLPEVEARALAFGEECLTGDGQVARFATMQTDIYLTVPVASLQDTAALGDLALRLLVVLDDFPVSRLEGPNPGYVGIRFQAGAEVDNLWFPRTKAEALRQQGLTGSDFYAALRNP